MESIRMSGNLSCSDVQEQLSDLLDVRRGELPHPDGTRLSEPGMRAAVELHLAACEACRAELKFIEETGAAFAEFAVAELPPQHFANYGQIVRDRMAGRPSKVIQFPQQKNKSSRRWMVAAASMAAAACLAFVVGRSIFNDAEKRLKTSNTKEIAFVRDEDGTKLPLLRGQNSPQRMVVQRPQDGILQAREEVTVNPTDTRSVDKLTADEGRYGYLVFGEKTAPGARPLLGVYLKTTRDVDRVQDTALPMGLMVWNVEPGSPAAMMGLRKGDYILRANDLNFESGSAEEAATFLAAVAGSETRDQIQLHVIRPQGSQYVYMKPMLGLLGVYE